MKMGFLRYIKEVLIVSNLDRTRAAIELDIWNHDVQWYPLHIGTAVKHLQIKIHLYHDH